MSADQPAAERPPLRLVRGDATPEEIAAVVALLAAASGGPGDGDGGGRTPSRWAAPAARVRPALSHGPGAWRGSALPH